MKKQARFSLREAEFYPDSSISNRSTQNRRRQGDVNRQKKKKQDLNEQNAQQWWQAYTTEKTHKNYMHSIGGTVRTYIICAQAVSYIRIIIDYPEERTMPRTQWRYILYTIIIIFYTYVFTGRFSYAIDKVYLVLSIIMYGYSFFSSLNSR